MALWAAVGLVVAVNSNAQETVLEEVVVTAQKRPQNPKDVGISITTFSNEQIEQLEIRAAQNVAWYTPGFLFTETAPNGVPVYTLRGVGFDDYSANSSPTVGFYADEVYLPYPTMTRGPLFDLGRIEVLKGPQGTLYGKNTTGGAVKFISNKPTETFEATAGIEVSRYDTYRIAGAAGGPLSGNLNGRFAFTTTQSNTGWQRSSSRDDRLGEQDVGAIRGLLDWHASEQVEVELMIHWYRDRSDNTATQYFAYVPAIPALAPFFPPPPESARPDLSDPRSADWSEVLRPERDNEGRGASITIDWQSNTLALTSITAWEAFERDEAFDWDGSYIENLDSNNHTEIDAWSQELRLASRDSGAVTWLAGIYFSGDEVTDQFLPRSSAATISQGIISLTDVRSQQDTDTAAAFAQVEWQLAESWRAIVGMRYTHEERKWTGCSHDADGAIAFLFNSDLGPIPGLADHFIISSTSLSPGDCATIDPSRASFDFDLSTGELTLFGGESDVFSDTIKVDNLSGKVGLDWTPNDDWLVYGSISSGFKSGGFNGAVASSWTALYPYREEELLSYELGLKATLLDGSMRFSGDVFYYDYQDKQVSGFLVDSVFGILTNLVNIPESDILGAEAELAWRATPGLYLNLGLAWLDTEIREFVALSSAGTLEDLSGMPLAQAPEWQINGLASHDWRLDNGQLLTLGADFVFSEDYYTAISEDPIFRADDYTVWNARLILTAEDEQWNMMLWGRNLGDHYYFTSANIANDYRFRTPGMGRTYGLTFNHHWR